MNTVIYSYNQYSEGAMALAKAMNIPRLRHDGRSKWFGGANKILINWGSSGLPDQFLRGGTSVVNEPHVVHRMTDKLTAFKSLIGFARVPHFTDSLKEANKWLTEGHMVFARTVLSGHSGNGIVIMDPEHPDTHNVSAKLFVRYVPKKDEYRVHIVGDKVILVQRKGLRKDFDKQQDVNWKIRNLANGFIFARDIEPPPADVINQAQLAMKASKLDFGAVDVIWNDKTASAYVLEINTAPGLVGTTINDYAKALAELITKVKAKEF